MDINPLKTKVVSCLLALSLSVVSLALDSSIYRLLSVTRSGKLVLISQPGTKVRYLLDAANAKITMNGKPVEFKDLNDYVTVQVQFDLAKSSKDGIEVDGVAREILIVVRAEKK
jgi:hypothetical protein